MMRKQFIYFTLFCSLIFWAKITFCLEWKLVDDGDPAGRQGHALAYDSWNGKTILFGGQVGGGPDVFGGTARDIWDYDGNNWKLNRTDIEPPLGGYNSRGKMVFDEDRKKIVLLIRRGAADQYLETWEYDGITWTQVNTQTPAPYGGIMMAYDSRRRRTVRFNHLTQNTWEYDGTDWTLVQTANNPNSSGYMVYDSVKNLIVFLNLNNKSLWQYDGNNWSVIPSNNVPNLSGGSSSISLAFNQIEKTLILYDSDLKETWVFIGSNWNRISTENTPSKRYGTYIVYDTKRNKVVLFGGRYILENNPCDLQIATYYDDTWEFDGINWVEIKTKSSPTARIFPGLAYHSDMKAMLMFGGYNVETFSGEGCPLNDTWLYNGRWHKLNLTTHPPPSFDLELTYDSNRKRIVMVGDGFYDPPYPCCKEDYVASAKTWEYDGTNWFEVITPTSAPKNIRGRMIFDSRRKRVLAIVSNYPSYNVDIWEYDGSDWSRVETTNSLPPRSNFSIAFDKFREKTILYGGWDEVNGKRLRDTWEYDGSDWSKIETPNCPTGSTRAIMAYDSERRVVILHGGWDEKGPSYETWVYDGNNWEKILDSDSPTIFSYGQMVFDENRKRSVLFGGIELSGATWELGEFTTQIDIDIKPQRYPNSINLKSKGVVSVAILTTDDFDAYDADPASCEFAGAYPLRWNMEDVDNDGDRDMLLHYMTQELGLNQNSTEAFIEGVTYDGIQIIGTDSVNIVPKPNKRQEK